MDAVSNKVNNPANPPASKPVSKSDTSQQSAKASPVATAAEHAKSSGVAVSVSNLAKSMSSTKADTPDVDSAKVATVKSAIQKGTYVVNHEAIADKLLSNAEEMLRHGRHDG